MSTPSAYAATIERMRRERNVPTAENRRTWSPGPRPKASAEAIAIHPRLLRIEAQLAKALRLDDPVEIRAALYDLQTLLVRCGYHLDLLRVERRWRKQDAKLARRLRTMPAKRGRGRPKDAVNFAFHQLGLGLATIWADFTGRRPGRRVYAIERRGESNPRGECGPFWDFVALVLRVLPAPLQMKRKGHRPRIDHFVRASVEAFKAAGAAPEEYRRRGLLDERRWLDRDTALPV